MDKLSQEVTTALAAGMSYGKWKAMQTKKKNRKRMAERRRIRKI